MQKANTENNWPTFAIGNKIYKGGLKKNDILEAFSDYLENEYRLLRRENNKPKVKRERMLLTIKSKPNL